MSDEHMDCPECGSNMERRSFLDVDGEREIYWVCLNCDYEETEIDFPPDELD